MVDEINLNLESEVKMVLPKESQQRWIVGLNLKACDLPTMSLRANDLRTKVVCN